MDWLSLFNITEVKNSDFQILAAGDDVVSSRRNSQGVDVSIMSLERVLDAEGLVVPNFEISIPSN